MGYKCCINKWFYIKRKYNNSLFTKDSKWQHFTLQVIFDKIPVVFEGLAKGVPRWDRRHNIPPHLGISGLAA